MNLTKGIQKSLGPGILLAGAAIGGSHLLSSTTAGARFGGIRVKDFVFAAMTGSFLTAPLFAWMAIDTINSKLVPIKNRYGIFLKKVSWIGLIFLTLFSLLFIANSFFGIGIY